MIQFSEIQGLALLLILGVGLGLLKLLKRGNNIFNFLFRIYAPVTQLDRVPYKE